MAPLDNNMMPAKGTTFYIGSWVFIADGSGGFDSHLIDPSAPKTSEATRRGEVNNFIDQLHDIPLPVHVKEVRNLPDFDVITPKTVFELEEDPDHLLEATRQGAIIDREAPTSEFHQDLVQDHTMLASNTVSPVTIENYLKDLMAIPRPRVTNSELLDCTDRVVSTLQSQLSAKENQTSSMRRLVPNRNARVTFFQDLIELIIKSLTALK